MSCEGESLPSLVGSKRLDVPQKVLSAMPDIFYSHITADTVFDKNFAWVTPENVQVIKNYIRPDPKVIVMIRPLEQVIKSFVTVMKDNGWTGDLEGYLMNENNNLIRKPLYGIEQALKNNTEEFLFVEYDDLVDSTTDVLKSIYEFCEMDYFEHDLQNIKNTHPEDDTYFKMIGLHDIRSSVSRRP